jgi:hypothetical protein
MQKRRKMGLETQQLFWKSGCAYIENVDHR